MKFFGIFLILFLCIGCVLSLYVNRQTKSFTNPRKDEGQPQGDAYGILSDVNRVTRDKTDTVTPDKAVTETTDKTWSSNSVSSTVIEQFIQDIAGNRTQTTKSKKKMALTLYFKSATRVLKVDRTDPDTVTNCHILEDRAGAADNGENALSTSDDALTGLLKACRHMKSLKNNKRKKRQFDVIYPGTKWCGIGTIADTYDDLGENTEADKCCREHDHCPQGIGTFERKYGLFNTALWYKSHCKCDQEFYDCLKTANTTTGDSVGNMYYNIISPQCIKKEFPEVCVKRGLFGICTKYKKDRSQPKIWKFKDNELSY